MKKIASRKDPRIIDLLIAHGAAGYGIYVMLVEYLGERRSFRSVDDIRRIAYELHADVDTVRSVLHDFNLFEIDRDGNISREGSRKPASESVPSVGDIVENSEDLAEEVNHADTAATPIVSRMMTRSERRRQQRLKPKSPDISLGRLRV